MGLLTIDPNKYQSTLVVAIDAPDEHLGCGVLASRYDPFTELEQNKFLPVFRDEDYGLKLYLLDRPESKARPNLISRWHYAAIGWNNAVYVEYPYSYEIILQELSNADGLPEWSVSVSGERGSFRLVLPDYKPGALIRDSSGNYQTVVLGNSDCHDLTVMRKVFENGEVLVEDNLDTIRARARKEEV